MVSCKAFVRSSPRLERRLRHGVLEHARTDRVPLGLVGIEQALRRCAVDHLGQLPSQVHGVLDTDVESLSACRGMHVRRVAGQEHPSLSVGRRLPGHIGEPREPRDVVNTEVGPVDGDERLAKVVQGRLVALPDVRLDQHHPHALPVLELAEAIDALVTTADAPRRLVGHLDLGNQVADGRIPPGKSIPAFLRIRLRPPSHPTRYFARNERPSDSSTSTPVSSWAKPVTSRPR